MKFFTGLVMVLALFLQGQAFAADKTSTENWLKEVRAMVQKIVPKKSAAKNSTAVSGVRGSDENVKDTLYWRGKKENISEEELASFNSALSLAEEGKNEEAIRKFEEFQKQYPSSALASDAQKTVLKIKNP
jgi:TolA-binding protein